MIKLIQHTNLLIGEDQAISELAKKDNARLILISDIHGNYNVLKQIILQYGNTCDGLVFSGDGISDLATLLREAKNNIELNNCVPPVIAFVRGNGDPGYFPMDFAINKSSKNVLQNQAASGNNKFYPLEIPQFQILEAAGKKIYITHGHHEGVYFSLLQLSLKAQMHECNCAIYGHTHIPMDVTTDSRIKLVNPGSCSLPRGGMPPSFAILTITPTVIDTAFIKLTNTESSGFEFKIFTPVM